MSMCRRKNEREGERKRIERGKKKETSSYVVQRDEPKHDLNHLVAALTKPLTKAIQHHSLN